MSIDETNPFIGIAYDDRGESMTATKDFFKDLDIYSEAVLADAELETSPTFGRTSDLYHSSSQFLDFLQGANQNFYDVYDTNQLNQNMKNYLADLETLTSVTVETDTLDKGGSVDLMWGLAKGADEIANQVVETGGSGNSDSTDGTTPASSSGTGAETYDLSDAQAAIDAAAAAETSGEKAGFLADAIEAVIAALTGGGEGEAPGNGGSGVSSDEGNGPGTNVSNPPPGEGDGTGGEMQPPGQDEMPPPEPETRMVTDTYTGDELMGKLYAGGEALTFDDSDNGIGVKGGEDDEIDGSEYMTFNAGGTVQGGEVVIEDLFANKGGKGQEIATIEVMENGKVVDTIQVNGDMDGQQSVRIDQPFDELKFSVDGEKGDAEGSFAVSSVSVDREETVEGAEGGTPAGGELVANNQSVPITEDSLVELLKSLGEVLAGISGLDLSEEEKAALTERIKALMQSVVDNLQGDEAGSPELTGQEFNAMMANLGYLLRDLESAAPEGETGINPALGTLGQAMSGIFEEVLGAPEAPMQDEDETLLV